MSTPPDCPGIECWEALLDGSLSPEQRERIEHHLESCPVCQERIDRDQEDQPILRRLGRLFGDPTARPAEVSRLLEQYLAPLDQPQTPLPPATQGQGITQMLFPCPECGRKLKARADLAGKKVQCPQCGQLVPVPAQQPKAPPRAQSWAWGLWLVVPLGLVLVLLAYRLFRPGRPASFLGVTLGNQFVLGVQETGFYEEERDGEGTFRWTDGQAKLVIPLDRQERPQGLLVQLEWPKNRALRIRVNQEDLLQEKASDRGIGWWERTFDLTGLELGDEMLLEITSDAHPPTSHPHDSRALGVKVRAIKLLREKGEPPKPTEFASFLNVSLGHQFVKGVEDSGFYDSEREGERRFRWTNGNGRLVIPLANQERPRALQVRLGRPRNRSLQIRVNGRELVKEPAGRQTPWRWWDRTFDLDGIELDGQVVVEIESNTGVPSRENPKVSDSRALGIQVIEIKLLP